MPRKHRIVNTEMPFHIWGRSNNKESFPLPQEDMWDLLTDYAFLLNKGFEIEIISFVLMINHFHMICRDPRATLSNGMEHFMRESSKETGRLSGRINKIWGAPYGASLIGCPNYFNHAYKYIYRNPVRAGLCERVEDYPYSSLAVLLGQRRSILPLTPDPFLFDATEDTLNWLNTDYSKTENESLRSAINKSKFSVRHDPSSRKPLTLEELSTPPITKR